MTGDTQWFTYESTLARGLDRDWRRNVAEILVGVAGPCWTVDDVILVAGELVANAIEHGGGVVRLRVTGDAGGAVVEVTDAATAVPAGRMVDTISTRGRGLAIIGALADDWGWRTDDHGKAVWASFGPRTDDRPRGSAA